MPATPVQPHAAVVGFAVHPVSSPGLALDSDSGPVIAIIPARYQSSRLPGKALADIGGRPMIEHVYRRAAAASSVSSVLVATDDERILEAVRAFGGTACLTSPDHPSGTDRLAEVIAELGSEIVVNVQGDEPLIEPAMIDEAVEPLLADPMVVMSTLRKRIDDDAELLNPNVTKVVVDREGYALYFSRAPIPFTRAGQPRARAWRHIGLYVYRSSRACRRRSWNGPKRSSSCGRSSTASASSRLKRSMIRSASTRRTTLIAYDA
jgi:3-deoxy-manno-octulosonate cytidylyltransferase (CMP-KDO synthetase)